MQNIEELNVKKLNIEELLNKFSNEVLTAARAFYVWKSIDKMARDDLIYQGINNQALVWNIIKHALQTTSLIVLGRIFEHDKRSLTIHTLLKKCITEVAQFGPNALRARKIRASHDVDMPWLDLYIANAQYPLEDDFIELQSAVEQFQERYTLIYQRIRNKSLAHIDIEEMNTIDEVYMQTDINDIQAIFERLYQISQVLHRWLYDGTRTELSDHEFKEEAVVFEEVKELMAQIRA
jgi:AbiU2